MAAEETGKKRKRRRYTEDFKANAVQLVEKTGKTMAEVGRERGLANGMLNLWVKQARIDAGKGPAAAMTSEEKPSSPACESKCVAWRRKKALLKNNRVLAAPSVARETPAPVRLGC